MLLVSGIISNQKIAHFESSAPRSFRRDVGNTSRTYCNCMLRIGGRDPNIPQIANSTIVQIVLVQIWARIVSFINTTGWSSWSCSRSGSEIEVAVAVVWLGTSRDYPGHLIGIRGEAPRNPFPIRTPTQPHKSSLHLLFSYCTSQGVIPTNIVNRPYILS
jgi:hypothetical protein